MIVGQGEGTVQLWDVSCEKKLILDTALFSISSAKCNMFSLMIPAALVIESLSHLDRQK